MNNNDIIPYNDLVDILVNNGGIVDANLAKVLLEQVQLRDARIATLAQQNENTVKPRYTKYLD